MGSLEGIVELIPLTLDTKNTTIGFVVNCYNKEDTLVFVDHQLPRNLLLLKNVIR